MKRATIHSLDALLASLLLGILLGCGGSTKKDDLAWPRWRGPNGDGVSKETGWDPTALSRGPRILWNTDIGIGYSNVAIENGRIYTMGQRRAAEVLSIDANSGRITWTFQVEGLDEQQSTPTVHDGFVYALTKRGQCCACKRRTEGWSGRRTWSAMATR